LHITCSGQAARESHLENMNRQSKIVIIMSSCTAYIQRINKSQTIIVANYEQCVKLMNSR